MGNPVVAYARDKTTMIVELGIIALVHSLRVRIVERSDAKVEIPTEEDNNKAAKSVCFFN